jgi:hypothetical protein
LKVRFPSRFGGLFTKVPVEHEIVTMIARRKPRTKQEAHWNENAGAYRGQLNEG